MPAPEIALTERFQSAFAAAFGSEFADADPIIRPSQFADFQCNAAMGLAKRLGRKPRDIAADILAAVDLSDMAETPEIAGPDFLNIRLRTDWVAAQAAELAGDARLGVPSPERAETTALTSTWLRRRAMVSGAARSALFSTTISGTSKPSISPSTVRTAVT